MSPRAPPTPNKTRFTILFTERSWFEHRRLREFRAFGQGRSATFAETHCLSPGIRGKGARCDPFDDERSLSFRSFRSFRSFYSLCGVLLYACSGPTYAAQQYDGDPRPSEEIAVVRVNAKDPVILDSLDGEAIAVRLPEDSRLHVEVLPGPHRVGVANALDPNAPADLVFFVAEPNKVYRPVLLANPPPASARVYEVDRDSDALVRDVTAAPKRRLPPLRRYRPLRRVHRRRLRSRQSSRRLTQASTRTTRAAASLLRKTVELRTPGRSRRHRDDSFAPRRGALTLRPASPRVSRSAISAGTQAAIAARTEEALPLAAFHQGDAMNASFHLAIGRFSARSLLATRAAIRRPATHIASRPSTPIRTALTTRSSSTRTVTP